MNSYSMGSLAVFCMKYIFNFLLSVVWMLEIDDKNRVRAKQPNRSLLYSKPIHTLHPRSTKAMSGCLVLTLFLRPYSVVEIKLPNIV